MVNVNMNMNMNMNMQYGSLYLSFVFFCFFVFLFFGFLFFCFIVSPLVRSIPSIPFSHGFVFMKRACMEIGQPRYEREIMMRMENGMAWTCIALNRERIRSRRLPPCSCTRHHKRRCSTVHQPCSCTRRRQRRRQPKP